MKKVGPLKTTSQSEDLKEKNKHVKRKKKKPVLKTEYRSVISQ